MSKLSTEAVGSVEAANWDRGWLGEKLNVKTSFTVI